MQRRRTLACGGGGGGSDEAGAQAAAALVRVVNHCKRACGSNYFVQVCVCRLHRRDPLVFLACALALSEHRRLFRQLLAGDKSLLANADLVVAETSQNGA